MYSKQHPNTIHYGVIWEEYADSVSIPQGFITDNDSFLDWGATQIDRTLHIQSTTTLTASNGIYETEDDTALKNLIELERYELSMYLTSGQRLIDYVVITDRNDWSENVHVWLSDRTMK